ncbi:alpha-ribazole kinase [Desulfitobacterium sp.]|uniref:alpha-ribazole kinase n=1 Tax=Desulfitobacterium sp. TaxID=49981 RepID=UPI002CDAD54E|nr:alpha-ribazole kinase [Desulfitobacterium sp.]HVJ47623.1 alpha-ribazole kinase [Desulfitobacterium sp.]
MGYKGRDVEVSLLKGEQCLVIACDSSGAIGSKVLDVVQVPEHITGRFTARVALLEVLAAGAEPKMLTVAISNEDDPTGEGILKGVREEIKSLDLAQLPLVISTEKNMITQQTGLGISVIGVADSSALRLATTQIGDFIYGLGLPKVGPDVADPEDPEIIRGEHIRNLLGQQGVHDIIPVGSQGIRGEAESLACSAKGKLILNFTCAIELNKSAGPATALIFSTAQKIQEDKFEVTLGLRPYFVGRIEKQ